MQKPTLVNGDLVMPFSWIKKYRIIKLYSNLTIWFIVLSIFSCNKENAPDCFQTAGEFTTVKRDLESFQSIELNDYIQIELYDTTAYFVEIYAPKNLIPDIATDVSNSQLKIENKNTCNFVRSFKKKLTVRIYAPDFSDIQNKGTGDITGMNTIECSYVKIENRHAAGVIKLSLETDSVLIATHTGVSDCYLSGSSFKTSMFNQGLGIMDARNLSSEFTFVNNSSINDVYVNSNDYLYASLYFSGNIYYSGNPNLIQTDIKGSGALKRLN